MTVLFDGRWRALWDYDFDRLSSLPDIVHALACFILSFAHCYRWGSYVYY